MSRVSEKSSYKNIQNAKKTSQAFATRQALKNTKQQKKSDK